MVEVRYTYDSGNQPWEVENLQYSQEKHNVKEMTKLLFADDAAVISKSKKGLEEMMRVVERVSRMFGLTVSQEKTEVMYCIDRETDTETDFKSSYNVSSKFVYLGAKITTDEDVEQEIKRRNGSAFYNIQKYGKKLFHNRAVRNRKWLEMKKIIFKQEVMGALLYGAETWTLNKKNIDLIKKCHRNLLLHLLGFPKSQVDPEGRRFAAYHDMLKMAELEPIEITLLVKRLMLAGKISRMEDDRLPKILLFAEMDLPSGDARKRRFKTWKKQLKGDLETIGIDEEEWLKIARDEKAWKKAVCEKSTEASKNWFREQERKAWNRRTDEKFMLELQNYNV